MTRLIVWIVAGASLAAAAQSGSNAPLFGPAIAVDVGGRSGEIILSDINRDGDLDLVAAHPPDPIVTVHIGDGHGTFTPAAGVRTTLPNGSGAIALGDLNGDGALDLVVASRDDSREYVTAMPGDGKGHFTVAAGSPHATGPSMVFYKPVLRLADVNEDGRIDIVSTNGRRNSLEILLGDGGGGFAIGPRVMLDAGRDFYTFGLADVDGDGHLDVVSSSAGAGSDRVSLKRGDGRGGFGNRIALPRMRPGARIVALADVTDDGGVDVVLAHADTPLVSVLVNAGNGMFTPAAGSPYAIAAEAFEVVVADVDRDGKADLVSAVVDSRTRPYNASIAVFRGDGHGFAPVPGSPFRVGRGAYHLAVGDVNRDGKLDLASSSFEGDPVTLRLGR